MRILQKSYNDSEAVSVEILEILFHLTHDYIHTCTGFEGVKVYLFFTAVVFYLGHISE